MPWDSVASEMEVTASASRLIRSFQRDHAWGARHRAGSSKCSINARGHQILARDSDMSVSSPASAKDQTSLCSHHEINGSRLAEESSTSCQVTKGPAYSLPAGWTRPPHGESPEARLRKGTRDQVENGPESQASRSSLFSAQMLLVGPLKRAPVIKFTTEHTE